MKLVVLEVDNIIFINDGLCSYYKRLWFKCEKLWTNRYIHTFFGVKQFRQNKSKGKLQTRYNP